MSQLASQQKAELLRPVAAYLVVPNVAVWLAGQVAYSVRAVVNLDYLSVGILAPWLPTAVTSTAVAVLVLLDLAATFAPIYHFSFARVLSSLGDALQLSPTTLLPYAAFAAAGALLIGVLTVRLAGAGRPTWHRVRAMTGVATVIVALDTLNGTSPKFELTTATWLPVNIATSPSLRLSEDLLRHRARRTGLPEHPDGPPAVPAATRRLITTASDYHPPNILVVLVESWGLFRDSTTNARLLAPYRTAAISVQYTLVEGTVPFDGATTAAEFRELCGVRADLESLPWLRGADCLPWQLRSQNYRTFAVHGYRRRFFDRNSWYPSVGFDSTLFLENLLGSLGKRYCGTLLRGGCDRNVAQVVAQLLKTDRPETPRFVYWLTLNSHLPVDPRSADASTFPCDTPLMHDRDICILTRTWAIIHSEVAAIATRADLPHPRIIVVGDHTPPFARVYRRRLFRDGIVPWIDLRPRVPGRSQTP